MPSIQTMPTEKKGVGDGKMGVERADRPFAGPGQSPAAGGLRPQTKMQHAPFENPNGFEKQLTQLQRSTKKAAVLTNHG